jgi:uncharacterized DUF497 family protein
LICPSRVRTIGSLLRISGMYVDFEWDPKKAEINRRNHGVSFADATTTFEDPFAVTIEEQDADGEERSVTAGIDCLGRLLVVVYS